MTNLTKKSVLAVSLSLLSATCLLPASFAQTDSAAAPAASAPAATTAKPKAHHHRRRRVRKSAKLKQEATDIVKNGVENANAKVTGK
ncbi:MAG TPA: hypothetical protein V6C89_16720 [Drouetiella sp.]